MIYFLGHTWYLWELLAVLACSAFLLCCAGAVCFFFGSWRAAARTWAASFAIIRRDPELFLLWALSTAVSFAPLTLLYLAAAAPATHAALMLLLDLAGAGGALSAFQPSDPQTLPLAALLAAFFAGCAALTYISTRLLNFAAVYTAWRRLAGGTPGLAEALAAVGRRAFALIGVLADFRFSAGHDGAFLPQYMLCLGQRPAEAAENSRALAAELAGRRAGPRGSAPDPETRLTRPAAELQTPLLLGFVPAWVFSFCLTFGLGPADAELWWIIFGLLGSPLIYMLAAANFVSFINSVYLTAFFFSRSGGRSPLLEAYPPAALRNPFRAR